MNTISIRKLTAAAFVGAALFASVYTAAAPVSAASSDGQVDGRDFLTWQRNVGPSASAGGSDLATWQANYGTGGY